MILPKPYTILIEMAGMTAYRQNVTMSTGPSTGGCLVGAAILYISPSPEAGIRHRPKEGYHSPPSCRSFQHRPLPQKINDRIRPAHHTQYQPEAFPQTRIRYCVDIVQIDTHDQALNGLDQANQQSEG